MFKTLERFLTIFFLIFQSVKLQNTTHNRRVFFGDPQNDFKYPHSSVVSIRKSSNWNETSCSGVIIGSYQVLSAAHCFTPRTQYRVGYGSQIISDQKLVNVEYVHLCGTIDVALLTLESSIEQIEGITFFPRYLWSSQDGTDIIKNKTHMCGYGSYEGPDQKNPRPTATDVLRCQSYGITVNYLVYLVKRMLNPRYPIPPTSTEGYEHDHRYLLSMSRCPLSSHARDANFSTGCVGDSGGPIFVESEPNKYKLLAIHQSGPSVCGDATNALMFDTAVHMTAVRNECF